MAKDNTLVYRAQTGDEGAFAELMREYYPFVYAVVIRIVNNSHDARGSCARRFLQRLSRINTARGCNQIQKAWLAEIAQNCTRNWLRKQRDDTVSIDEVSEQILQTEDSSDEQLIRQEQRELIRRIMETLPQKDREIARAYYLDGASYDELISTHGLSIQRNCVSAVACEASTHQTVAISSDRHLRFSRNDTEKNLLRRFNHHESWNSS